MFTSKELDNDIDNFLKSFEESGNVIDNRFIKNLLKKWHIKNLKLDNDGKVTNKYAIEEMNKLYQSLLSVSDNNRYYFLFKLTKILAKNANADLLCSLSVTLCQFCYAIFICFSRKIKNPTDLEKVLLTMTNSGLINFTGAVTSYLTGDYVTIMQKIRIIYECLVVFNFIKKHKELAKPFMEHISYIESKIYRTDSKNHVSNNNQINRKIYDYDWAHPVFPNEKKINLLALANDVGIPKGMSEFYNLSSNFIHTNAYSAFMTNQLKQSDVREYLPMISSMAVKQTMGFIKVINPVEIENEILCCLLTRLEDCFLQLSNTERLRN